MRLSVNLASLNIYNEQTKNLKTQSKAMARISSGVKINSAAESPNAIAQSEKLRMQIRGLQVAQRNSQDGVSMLQNAEGALDSVTSMVQRIRELAVQAGGTNTPEDRITIQSEISQMIKGIDDTVNFNDFNGVKIISDSSVLDNSNPNYIDMLVGANVGDTTKIPKYDLTSGKLGDITTGMVLANIDVTQAGGIDKALVIADNAIITLLSARSNYGALQNRFESTYSRTEELTDSVEKAESGLRDADIATEMMEFSRSGILIEAANALMVQTNRFPQDMLRILENVR